MGQKSYVLIFLFCYVVATFAQIPTTTPTAAPTTTPKPPPCSNHGTCICNFGYTGPDCSEQVNWCEQKTIEVDGNPIVKTVCGDRGDCVSSPAGARCNCHPGYSGTFCDTLDPSELFLSNRCHAYNSSYTDQLHWSPDDQIGCAAKQECVPDDLQCLLTMCETPIGWCLPNPRAKTLPAEYKTREFEGVQWFYKDVKGANGPCSDHGHCNCNSGYTGADCELDVDWCNTVAQGFNGTGLIKEACGFNGTCASQPAGAFCICDEGFTGQFCNEVIPSEVYISRRCYVYKPTVPPQPNVPVGCADGACVPENLQCFVPLTCANPIGWCLDMVPHTRDQFNQLVARLFTPTN